MKTTLRIPDAIFCRAKAMAAQHGIPFRQFVSEAVAEKLEASARAETKPWMALVGQLRHLRSESARINALIEDEFETIQ